MNMYEHVDILINAHHKVDAQLQSTMYTNIE